MICSYLTYTLVDATNETFWSKFFNFLLLVYRDTICFLIFSQIGKTLNSLIVFNELSIDYFIFLQAFGIICSFLDSLLMYASNKTVSNKQCKNWQQNRKMDKLKFYLEVPIPQSHYYMNSKDIEVLRNLINQSDPINIYCIIHTTPPKHAFC